MPALRLPRVSELVAALLGCFLANLACRSDLLPQTQPGANDTPLSAYRDSLLDVDMEYPEGWIPDLKKTYGSLGPIYNLYFEPPQTLATRRFTVRIAERPVHENDRELEDFKAEYLARLLAGNARLIDSGYVVIGGEPGFQAEYQTLLDGKPHVRALDILCRRPGVEAEGRRRPGRDFSITFEAAEASADADMLLFARVADRFRFYAP